MYAQTRNISRFQYQMPKKRRHNALHSQTLYQCCCWVWFLAPPRCCHIAVRCRNFAELLGRAVSYYVSASTFQYSSSKFSLMGLHCPDRPFGCGISVTLNISGLQMSPPFAPFFSSPLTTHRGPVTCQQQYHLFRIKPLGLSRLRQKPSYRSSFLLFPSHISIDKHCGPKKEITELQSE